MPMPAYVIADIEVTDPEAYREYAERVPATIASHGGRYLARGGEVDVLEGDWQPSRLVILEFPTSDDARAWYHSAAYEAVKEVRLLSSHGQLVLTEGVPQVEDENARVLRPR